MSDMLARVVERQALRYGHYTPIDGVLVSRFASPTEPITTVMRPVYSVIMQGMKEAMIGSELVRYRAGQSLIAGVDLPVTSRILEASGSTPYLSVSVEIDRAILLDLLEEHGGPATDSPRTMLFETSQFDPRLADPLVRLLELVDYPEDIPVLAPAVVSGGSSATASMAPAIMAACAAIRKRLGMKDDDRAGVLAALARSGAGVVEELGESRAHGNAPETMRDLYRGKALPSGGAGLADRVQFALGAQFVEIRVHALTREIRVARAVGAFACGRIINARTAHGQLVGGMIWGIGSALHEQSEVDARNASYINANLADYLVPVNADIASVEAIMVAEEDRLVNSAGVKGVGEIGVVGMAAAISNAVFHATGRRLRSLPIRIEDLL